MTSFKDEDNFRQRHEADMADLRSQLLELKKSQLQSSIGMSSSTATASYTTSNVPAVTTVLYIRQNLTHQTLHDGQVVK
jgi:hypothetical protein